VSPGPETPRAEPAAPTNPRIFRWQALLERIDEPVFVLNQRRHVIFVNRAWESLTGLPAVEGREIACRRRQPALPGDPLKKVLAHVLCPPEEVMRGELARVRRLLPGRPAGSRWWEIEHLPLSQQGQVQVIIGRILPLLEEVTDPLPPLPEKLLALRQCAGQRLTLQAWASELPAMRRLVEQVRLASRVGAPVLLVGEAGTGKKSLARLIHRLGSARETSFATLDCGRLPPAVVAGVVLEDRGDIGREALGGVYLKEPGQLPRDLQQRLAELLSQEGRGPRILAGCTAESLHELRPGRVSEELQCALGVLRIDVPPLRERRADLHGLVDHLLQRLSSEGPRVRGLSSEAWEVVQRHPWPGNLRELADVLAGAVAHATSDQIQPADLPLALRLGQAVAGAVTTPEPRPLPLDELLQQVERRLIQTALQRTAGHLTRAAEILGIWRYRLKRRMIALGLAPTEDESADAEVPPES
jgi:transcriptional regulator with PAS, ATPase and Fis domain